MSHRQISAWGDLIATLVIWGLYFVRLGQAVTSGELAQAGFARRVRFLEHYDPSLPPVLANRDQLVQVFLNLVKNAVEAIGDDWPKILRAKHAYNLTRERLHGKAY